MGSRIVSIPSTDTLFLLRPEECCVHYLDCSKYVIRLVTTKSHISILRSLATSKLAVEHSVLNYCGMVHFVTWQDTFHSIRIWVAYVRHAWKRNLPYKPLFAMFDDDWQDCSNFQLELAG